MNTTESERKLDIQIQFANRFGELFEEDPGQWGIINLLDEYEKAIANNPEKPQSHKSELMRLVSGTKLYLEDNRLFIAVGIVVICYGAKVVFWNFDAETTKQFLIYSAIRDITDIGLIWLGISMIFNKRKYR